ncbi:glycoside hydrolase family 18 protein [Ferrimonas futtsuensis]|uniref:glycoside hydrolase family 18 protein n=1 Tax=Ferrimonas futtsuensis TaxID=364764 RepID=UPI0004030E39|nr:glycoside hydrolase family 18 protein [Ferrimonas futtsuensis]
MSQPKLVSYFSSGNIPLGRALDRPYTHLILAFLSCSEHSPFTLELSGAIAAQTSPPQLTQGTKQAIRQLQQQGIKVMISFGGATMTSAAYRQLVGQESYLAYILAQFVTHNELDGIDIDWEDSAAFVGQGGYDGIEFLVNLTLALRRELPSDRYLISHAPQPPYLESGYRMSGYLKVLEQAGSAIDMLNIQFYNNRPWSGDPLRIVESYQRYCRLPGMSPDKAILGLPVSRHNAQASSYIPVERIVTEIVQPLKAAHCLGGLMNWEFASDTEGHWSHPVSEALEDQSVTG